ncbi:MAG: sugar transferase [Hyphomonadaceae bacterium]|nr:sugar transferase [Hyphomonadaceae bacterium]
MRPYSSKRVADAALAALLLALTMPALILIWLLVVATSQGPGLYWSRRVGLHGKIFLMPKFRTMDAAAPEAPREALSVAQCQITPLGALLRRMSLDELPQLWTILRGDMSFIGPRPLMPDDPAALARRHFPDAFSVRPGLSGLAQISGRNHVTPRRKARLDALYARRASPGLDAQIFFRTALIVVTGQGFI